MRVYSTTTSDPLAKEQSPPKVSLRLAVRLTAVKENRLALIEQIGCNVQLLSSRLEATLLSIPASPANRATWIRGDGLVFLKRNVITVIA